MKRQLRRANLAGRAIDITRTTAAHAFTSAHRIPHGHAVWLSLPAVALYNAAVSFPRPIPNAWPTTRARSNRAKPFYRSATPIVLGKPPMEESRTFLTDRFRSVGMKLPDAVADAILFTSDNIPYYLQAVALRTWMAASRRGVPAPGKEDVETALDDLVGLHRATYEATATALSETQRRLLSAIARDPVARFDADWRAHHFLPGTTTLGSAATKLLNAGLIERGDSC